MNLGKLIKNKRTELGMTTEELGNKIGKNKTFVSRLETGKVKTIKYEMIQPLSEALGIPINVFFENINDNVAEEITATEFKKEVKDLLDKTQISDKDRSFINAIIDNIDE